MSRVFGLSLCLIVVLSLLACSLPGSDDGQGEIVLVTTTSLQDSGLLDELLPLFEEETGYTVKPIAVGTGAALEMGARGEADVVFAHAPEAERQWMANGYGTDRILVMYNDFIIVGPPDDPAGLRNVSTATEALELIDDGEVSWVSRDDNSGTHQLEQRLWRDAGLDPAGAPWLTATGQGMGATLILTDQTGAYTLSDRGTWLASRDNIQLEIVLEGDPALLNLYHVLVVDPDAFPDVEINAEGAKAFADFLVSQEAQAIIQAFGQDRFGQSLFNPAGGRTEAEFGQ